jgi:hypothetical protein
LLYLLDSTASASGQAAFKIGLIATGAVALLFTLWYAHRVFTTSRRKGSETAYDRWVKQYSSTVGGAQSTEQHDGLGDAVTFQYNPMGAARGGRNKFATPSLDPQANAELAIRLSQLEREEVGRGDRGAVNLVHDNLNPRRQNPLIVGKGNHIAREVVSTGHVDHCEL